MISLIKYSCHYETFCLTCHYLIDIFRHKYIPHVTPLPQQNSCEPPTPLYPMLRVLFCLYVVHGHECFPEC